MAAPASNEVVVAPAEGTSKSVVSDLATTGLIRSSTNTSSETSSPSRANNVQARADGDDATTGHTDTKTSTEQPLLTSSMVADDASRNATGSAEMTATTSAKSTIQPVDNLDGTTDTSTYGTRSRNRTGNARPNYAEDQDMDYEYSSTTNTTTTAAAQTTTTKRRAAAAAATAAAEVAASSIPNATDGSKRAQESARFVAVNGSNGTPKESTPSSGGTAPTTKKRKAAATAAAGNAPGSAAANSSASGTSRKAAGGPASSLAAARETNLMTFNKHKSRLNAKGELIADDGTKLCVNDHVYLVCEPPGDPYYLCRIMEFLHVRSDDPSSPIDALRVNWYYRPRDVQRFNSDSRLVYGTMHSDICPLLSLRGTCTIRHRSEIADLDAYRKERDSFYFVQVFDRFIRRWYECIPVGQIINVPEKVKKALDERWKFVVVEMARVKELTSAMKTCKRCARYCATNDSVTCAICKNSYHMNCIEPPLPKKPSRGFAWSCAPCSSASERKLEQKNTPSASGNVTEAEEEEAAEEEQPSGSNGTTRGPSPTEDDGDDDMIIDQHPATQAEIALAKMWPMRYLGIHCRVEDALQYDDRAIYPRASSRLGPRHQANVNIWHGHPVELVKPSEIKKRYNKPATKKDPKMTKETIAAIEADREERAKRPKWVQDEPTGYVARGDEHANTDTRNTARLLFKMPPQGEHSERGLDDKPVPTLSDDEIDSYVKRAKVHARAIGVPPFGANFLDKVMELLTLNNHDQEAALKKLAKLDRVRDLHEPVLSRAELVKFEEGVAKYGSEHRLIHLHMNTDLPISTIIRFYYLWKKTPKGHDIWGNYGGRKGSKRKVENDAGAQLQQSVAHDVDDSAFDNDKAVKKTRGFVCKFCNTAHSRQWRRAPGVSAGQTVPSDGKNGKEKGKPLLLALCLRCAGLWRKYAIQWEEIDEVSKKAGQGGGKAWKKRIDEELLRELIAATEASSTPNPDSGSTATPSIEANEPPKKKAKTEAAAAVEPPKKKEKPPPPPKEPTPPPPPIVPTPPVWRELPCAVCKDTGETLQCMYCKLTVHRHCFGLPENEGIQTNGELKWVCEQCQNDRNPTASTDYACILCLTEETQIELVETPRTTHKKKTDRDREKERLEKELADEMRTEYVVKQQSLHRPVFPREPLKRTTGNNWVHVYCAVWTPEIRFSDANALEVAEGFQQILPVRWEAICKLCKNKDHQNRFRDDRGGCVSCFQCHSNFHVSCAFEAGFTFGFDVTPVKGSRKDQILTATLGEETGAVTAGIWCKEHVIKTTVHPVNELADPETGKTALQVFVETYKQADLTLTGTVRKANIVQLTKDKSQASAASTSGTARRESAAINGIAAAVRRGGRTSLADTKTETDDAAMHLSEAPEARRCGKCGIDVTPKWHAVSPLPIRELTPPRSPSRRMSMAVGDLTEQDRDRLEATENSQASNQNNIRFMAPGASGRAWEGMPERYGTRGVLNGNLQGLDVSPGGIGDGIHHNHALPRFQNPASTNTVANSIDNGTGPNKSLQDFLCHRCFLKRKLDPSPPPEERPRTTSPAHTNPPHNDWRDSQPPPTFDPHKPIRMPQDEPARQEPPPPPMNMPVQYQQPPATYPHYAPNAPLFHGPPPPAPPPPQPPSIHERQGSFGFSGPPPQPPALPSSAPYGPYGPPPPPQPPRASPYPPHYPPPQPSNHPAMSNGMGSPQPSTYGSPGHHAPPPPYPTYPPRRPDDHMPAPLPPIGVPPHQAPPYHSSPPSHQHPFTQPHQGPPPPPPAPPQHHHHHHHQQHPLPSPRSINLAPSLQHPSVNGPHPPPHSQLPPPGPQTSAPRPPSQSGRSSTPSGGVGDGHSGAGPSAPATANGASTSPSLNNLLS